MYSCIFLFQNPITRFLRTRRVSGSIDRSIDRETDGRGAATPDDRGAINPCRASWRGIQRSRCNCASTVQYRRALPGVLTLPRQPPSMGWAPRLPRPQGSRRPVPGSRHGILGMGGGRSRADPASPSTPLNFSKHFLNHSSTPLMAVVAVTPSCPSGNILRRRP